MQGVSAGEHSFGGLWTAEKLRLLGKYLEFYTTALKGQPFKLVYIDAFAGTGRCQIKLAPGNTPVIDGSATVALDCTRPFDEYIFIEKKAEHADQLERLKDSHRNGARIRIGRGSAVDLLPMTLRYKDWKSTRGVLFLDPYGLQCDWQLLKEIQATKALDLFFLVSLSSLFRLAAVDQGRMVEGHADRLTRFLGTDEWKSALYTREQDDLFDAPSVSRHGGWKQILDFTTRRLATLFPHVADPVLLGKTNRAPQFALYFAVSNPSEAAINLAKKVNREIVAKMR